VSLDASADPDTMYWDRANIQPDKYKIYEAALPDINTHEEQRHCILVPKQDVPKGTLVLDAAWSMKRKRR
jgi:hypothetical protein